MVGCIENFKSQVHIQTQQFPRSLVEWTIGIGQEANMPVSEHDVVLSECRKDDILECRADHQVIATGWNLDIAKNAV